MSALLDLLTRYPNCKVTIRSGPSRPKPYEGQLRVLARKGRLIRVQQRAEARGAFKGYCCVRNGRPVWEWVPESSLSVEDQRCYAQRRAERGDPA